MEPLTFTGTLVKQPEIRQTRERTLTVERRDPVAQGNDPHERRTRSRAYIVFSLTRRAHPGGEAKRYRCTVWNPDPLRHRPIRWANQGDLVKIQGCRERFRYQDDRGTDCELRHIVVEELKVLPSMEPITLIGNLGRAPEIRQTRERTVTVERLNPVAQVNDTFDFRTRSRDYIVFSLAHRTHPAAEPRWYRCTVWNGDQPCHRQIRWANPGDLVKVTGRREVFRYTNDKGANCELRHLVIQDFAVLARSRMYPVVESW